ncbi:MAG: DUF1553 domain-containing protein, partial [Planctomycetota bacterium]
MDDGSFLLTGDVPVKDSDYEISLPTNTNSNVKREPISAIRLDALRHDELPGGGPGRGDQKRTNFVLNRLTLLLTDGDTATPIPLTDAKASFSQKGYEVDKAIDGPQKTGWAIAPEFDRDHWAEFQLVTPVTLHGSQSLRVVLNQKFGRGRVIGRPKISFLTGPTDTVGLTDEIVDLLSRDSLNPKQQQRLQSFFRKRNPKLRSLRSDIQTWQTQIAAISPASTLVMVEMKSPRETRLMQRGNYLSPGDSVLPTTPRVLHPMDESLPRNRLGLAKWLVDPQNPLLARVTVNRLWAQVFGKALVTTQEDFGTQSEPPSHPSLLDWLASEFMRSGWSIKHMLRLMVHSQTFQQSSRFTNEQLDRDPENRWWSHGPRYRLPAETIRDNALAISGLLSHRAGGPPIMPYQPDGLWRAVGRNQPTWKASLDDDRFRRGLYVVLKRGAPYPSFTTFDAPDRASCTVKRSRTNTPLQALVLMNDRSFAEAAMGFAARIVQHPWPEPMDQRRIENAYRMATGRDASQRTTTLLMRLLEQQRRLLEQQPDLAKQRLSLMPKGFLQPDLDRDELAAWFALTSVLLNL